jgi:hypothetical protein
MLFSSSRFEKVSNNGFFVSIDDSDPKFDMSATKNLLTDIGGKNVEVLSEE